jgi:hypothetical protein
MMPTPAILEVPQHSKLADMVGGNAAGSEWLFPVIETIHVLSLATVFGSITVVDLRLLGISSRSNRVSKLSEEVLPWTWTAFVLAAITGSLLFISKATIYWNNPQFEMKFLSMFLAAVNMMVFRYGVFRCVADWDTSLPTPLAARVAGTLSICLWIVVTFMVRWIGFTT